MNFDYLLPLGLFVCLFCSCPAACGILVPQPGIQPVPPAVEAQSPNPWTTREFPYLCFFVVVLFFNIYLLAAPGLSCSTQDLVP